MKTIKNKIKEEKGSITLFVLIVCIFVVVVLFAINAGIFNKKTGQEKELKKITQEYSNNEAQMNKAYTNVIQK